MVVEWVYCYKLSAMSHTSYSGGVIQRTVTRNSQQSYIFFLYSNHHKKIPNYFKLPQNDLKSTPALLPLIFLQLVQRARDRAVSLEVYYIAVTFFMIKELFSLQLLSFELIH